MELGDKLGGWVFQEAITPEGDMGLITTVRRDGSGDTVEVALEVAIDEWGGLVFSNRQWFDAAELELVIEGHVRRPLLPAPT